mgnify:CR=1 FL=1
MVAKIVSWVLGLGLMIMVIKIGIGLTMMMVVMMTDVMARLRSIAGWAVVPRMAPPPSQGGST